MLWANTEMDVIDAHVYWQHPSWPGVNNTAQVNDPAWSTVVRLGRAAVKGKPFTVSEANHAFPNDWLCEGVPTLAAYASLQDWDAVMWYTYEPKRNSKHEGYIGDAFDLSHDPVRWTQFTAGALMFLRGDVAPAREEIVRNYTPPQIYETMRMPRSSGPLFTPNFLLTFFCVIASGSALSMDPQLSRHLRRRTLRLSPTRANYNGSRLQPTTESLRWIPPVRRH